MNVRQRAIGRRVSTVLDKKLNSFGVAVHSNKFGSFLSNLGVVIGRKKELSIPKWITKDRAFLKAFIRGFFDTDGSVTFRRNYTAKDKSPRIIRFQMSSTSKVLAIELSKILVDLGFRPYSHSFMPKPGTMLGHRITIEKRSDIPKWISEIGFDNPKHQTKYLVWKKFGVCPPRTTILDRQRILNGNLDPLHTPLMRGWKSGQIRYLEDKVKRVVP